MHIYWKDVLETINRVFQVHLAGHPKLCLLGIIDDVPEEEASRLAIARALFQARKLILRHWKSTEPLPPTMREWLNQMGDTIRLEKSIYQHRGSVKKFNKFWAPWLDVPGLAPVDLIMERLLL